MTCVEVRAVLGAYVAGALDRSQADEVREHLAACPGCAAEAEALGGTLALLDLAPAAAYEDPAGDDPPALRRLLDAADTRHQASRRRTALLAVAAVLVLTALAGLAGLAVGRSAAETAAVLPTAAPVPPAASPLRVVSASDTATGVTASIGVVPRRWGSALQLELTGAPQGERCRLVAEAQDGSREVGATWAVPLATAAPSASPGAPRRLRLDGAVGMDGDTISRFVVETLAGEQLVAVEDR